MSKKIQVKKSCLSELGRNGGLALAWTDITWAELSEKSQKPSISSDLISFPPRYTNRPLQSPPKEHRTPEIPTNTARHLQTLLDAPQKLVGHPWNAPKHHHTICAQHSKARLFSTWIFWDIKISKPPYVSLPKIIGFCHFSWFLGLSEKNYKLQSLWITL